MSAMAAGRMHARATAGSPERWESHVLGDATVRGPDPSVSRGELRGGIRAGRDEEDVNGAEETKGRRNHRSVSPVDRRQPITPEMDGVDESRVKGDGTQEAFARTAGDTHRQDPGGGVEVHIPPAGSITGQTLGSGQGGDEIERRRARGTNREEGSCERRVCNEAACTDGERIEGSNTDPAGAEGIRAGAKLIEQKQIHSGKPTSERSEEGVRVDMAPINPARTEGTRDDGTLAEDLPAKGARANGMKIQGARTWDASIDEAREDGIQGNGRLTDGMRIDGRRAEAGVSEAANDDGDPAKLALEKENARSGL